MHAVLFLKLGYSVSHMGCLISCMGCCLFYSVYAFLHFLHRGCYFSLFFLLSTVVSGSLENRMWSQLHYFSDGLLCFSHGLLPLLHRLCFPAHGLLHFYTGYIVSHRGNYIHCTGHHRIRYLSMIYINLWSMIVFHTESCVPQMGYSVSHMGYHRICYLSNGPLNLLRNFLHELLPRLHYLSHGQLHLSDGLLGFMHLLQSLQNDFLHVYSVCYMFTTLLKWATKVLAWATAGSSVSPMGCSVSWLGYYIFCPAYHCFSHELLHFLYWLDYLSHGLLHLCVGYSVS